MKIPSLLLLANLVSCTANKVKSSYFTNQQIVPDDPTSIAVFKADFAKELYLKVETSGALISIADSTLANYTAEPYGGLQRSGFNNITVFAEGRLS